MKRWVMAVTASVLTFQGCVQAPQGQRGALAAPEALTVEYLRDPVGLDTAAPRLSWKLAAANAKARDLRQTAYRVLVASTPENLRRDRGDLWDSGRVASAQSLNVVYRGVPLQSSQRCYWKVRAWDNTGDAPSAWSVPGRWITGVMRPGSWQAKWIGANAATRPPCDLAGAQWLWTGDPAGLDKAAAGKRYFRKVFHAPQGAQDICYQGKAAAGTSMAAGALAGAQTDIIRIWRRDHA